MDTSSIIVGNVGNPCLRLKHIHHISLAYIVGMLTGSIYPSFFTSKIKVYVYCLHYIYFLSNPYHLYALGVGINAYISLRFTCVKNSIKPIGINQNGL